ncbi:hypothetical protein ODZ83_08470 [Acaricomes phytoseiuli]|uniref:hypothetical protein n=1 Tax=Acaricomes phytoseiuli TaxID=291968 RepID=UPI001FE1C54A|nr:hypothetical protein [Acaricomes phytoseiuli]MCW1250209.1 hypothetical protein [Acaricomes phytoseiuli]
MTTDDLLSCGRSIDELSDYLAARRQPADPYIDSCPECQAALDALSQLNEITGELITHESQPTNQEESTWLSSIFSNIALEAHSGRTIPLTDPSEGLTADDHGNSELSQTEGSVIALIRSFVDSSDGAMVGRCRLKGEITEPGAAVSISIRVTALLSGLSNQPSLQRLAMQVRDRIKQALAQHTQLRIEAIDITISDVRALQHEDSRR